MRRTSPNKPLRSHHRKELHTPLSTKIPRLAGQARAEDFGEGGMGLVVPRHVGVGDMFDLDITLEDGSHCTVRGEVCYLEEMDDQAHRHAGLRWIDLTREQREAVKSYCRKLR